MTNPTIAATEIAKLMNLRLHAEKLNIPVLNGFEVEASDVPSVILLAKNNGIIEQLVSDGYISEPVDERIKLVIDNTKKFMQQSGCLNIEDSFIYYKDVNNGTFDFKIYFTDIIMKDKVIRQINAYFVEPMMHDFYQLSLSTNAISYPTEILKVGCIDLENDQITKMLDNLMNILINNLKYK